MAIGQTTWAKSPIKGPHWDIKRAGACGRDVLPSRQARETTALLCGMRRNRIEANEQMYSTPKWDSAYQQVNTQQM